MRYRKSLLFSSLMKKTKEALLEGRSKTKLENIDI